MNAENSHSVNSVPDLVAALEEPLAEAKAAQAARRALVPTPTRLSSR